MKFHRPCMDSRLSSPCSSISTVQATMDCIRMWYQVHILSICTLKLSERFHKLYFLSSLLVSLHLPSSLWWVNLRTIIKWVILIQIWFCQLLWVLWGKRKRWEKTHFDIFGLTDCDLSTSSPISSNSNILGSAHPIENSKIVPENLSSREDMVKNPFLRFWVFHLWKSLWLFTYH